MVASRAQGDPAACRRHRFGDEARVHQSQARGRGEPPGPGAATDRGAAGRRVAAIGAREGAGGAAREHRARAREGRRPRRSALAPRAHFHRGCRRHRRGGARRRAARHHRAVKRKQAELFGDAPALPEGFVFQVEFITPQEERSLLDAIAGLKLETAKYKQYTARRRIAYFGFGYDFVSNRLGEAPAAPTFLAPLRAKVAAWMELGPEALEQALVTEYRPGTPLGWHRDAPDYGRVAGVSLGGWARMRLRTYSRNEPLGDDKPMSLDLPPRSAYQMNGPARWHWQHAIPATKELRYSITFRTLRAATE